MSEYDLGYRGLFRIQWGYLKWRFDMWWFMFRLEHRFIDNLIWKFHMFRFKSCREGKILMTKDRLTGKKKEVGRFC